MLYIIQMKLNTLRIENIVISRCDVHKCDNFQFTSQIYKSLEHIHRTRCFIDDYKQCNVLILDVCECVARVQMIDIKPNLCLKLEELEVKLKGSREKAISTITDQYCKIFNYLLVVREGKD